MLSSWQIQLALDATTRAAASSPSQAFRLFDAPRAEPSREQRAVLSAVVDHARFVGLRLPVCRLFWVLAPPDVIVPACVRNAGGVFSLAVAVNRAQGADLVLVVLHEVQHLADWHSGGAFTREQMELRAEAFAQAHAAEVEW